MFFMNEFVESNLVNDHCEDDAQSDKHDGPEAHIVNLVAISFLNSSIRNHVSIVRTDAAKRVSLISNTLVSRLAPLREQF